MFGRLDKMVAPGRPGNKQNAICRAPDQSTAALPQGSPTPSQHFHRKGESLLIDSDK